MANRNSLQANSLPYDPSELPPAVRRAAAAAEALQKQSIEAPQPEPPPQPEPAPQPQPQPEQTIVIANPPPEPQPEPGPKPSYEELENLYKSAVGRDRAQRLQISQLNDRIDGLQNVIATMQAAPAPAAPDVPVPMNLITDEDRANYGEDMLELIGRKAQEIAAPLVAGMKTELENVKQQLRNTSSVIVENARDSMMATLDQRLPSWKKQNFDPDFISWLALPDALSGVKRQTLLSQAFEQNDTFRVLAFFTGFLSEKAVTAPANDPAALPAPREQPDRPSLESFAAPGRARTSASTPLPEEKPIIKTSEIAAFYAAVRKNLYAGKEDEKKRLEEMIFSAQAEGRVRVG